MRTSKFLLATLREEPKEAEVISHKLMMRAGMIRKLASGIYTWLPLGLLVLRKLEQIIREEMNRIGALEILMPAVQPRELWEETQRWTTTGEQLLKIQDRHGHDFCFGPTHEEVVTDLIRRELRSYRQFPIMLYQIQTKFRDEIRPRFGVMRGREFLMKDAYSFHTSEESLEESYQAAYGAYQKIFTRLGLKFRAVIADNGNIGGNLSQEFQVLANSGEDVIAYSEGSDYAANLEMAEALVSPAPATEPELPQVLHHTPAVRTVAEVSNFLQIAPSRMLKTILVKGSEVPCIALVLRGDHELNEVKLSKLPELAQPFTRVELPLATGPADGLVPGFLGPIDLPLPMIVDRDAAAVKNFVCGANRQDYHLANVNWGRDLALPPVADLRNVVAGDLSPDGCGTLQLARGIEVGQVFKLGKKYSRAMKAGVLGEAGRPIELWMGCYGIGVSRTVAAAIEQNHDERGIIWPTAIAPFQLVIIPMSLHKSYRVREQAELLYQQLKQAGVDVLLDDRNERAGVLFSDMDLIGIPHRLVISESGLDRGSVEYKSRVQTESVPVALAQAVAFVQEKIRLSISN